MELERNGFFEEHVFACKQAFTRHGVMRRLGRRRDHDRIEILDLEELAIICRCRARIGFFRDFRETLASGLDDVKVLYKRARRTRFSADTAAPAGADHGDVDLSQLHILWGIVLSVLSATSAGQSSGAPMLARRTD